MNFSQENTDELRIFEEIFRRNYNDLCNSVFFLVKDASMAEDIVQNVFFKYWKNRNAIKIHSSTEAYIFKACIHESHTALQSIKRRGAINFELFLNKTLSTNDVEEQYQLQETSLQIQKVIDALPPACKEVFLLSRYKEMSHQEIARHLNISPNTVNNHIKKALSFLREVVFALTLFLI